MRQFLVLIVPGAFTLPTSKKEIPGFAYPWYGEQVFSEYAIAENPWAKSSKFLGIEDLEPTAPLDSISPQEGGTASSLNSWTGAAPRAPEGYKNTDLVPGISRPDIISSPLRTFPKEFDGICTGDNREIHIDSRNIYGKPDRLRTVNAEGATTLGKLLPTLQGGDQESIQRSYPLQNPYDRTSPVTPLAGADRLPGEVSRFLDQLHRGDFKRRDANDRVNIFEKTDENGDNMISWGEFQKEVQGHQSKTDAETLALWNRYKPATAASMSAETFQKLAGTGFAVADLQGKSLSANENTRTDTTGSVSVICPINLGYWGGLVRCPKNRPVVGARLKFNFVKKQADNTDNSVDKTALNAVELRCGEPLTEPPAGPLPSITATTTPPSAAASAPINSDAAKTLPATDTVTTTIDPVLNPGQNGVPNPYTTGLVQKETALQRATSALEANVHLGEHMMMEQGEGVITTITEKSSDGTRMRDFIVLKSAEGKDGIWSEWNDCPSHGEVRGFRSRMSVFEPERDNSALNDLAFICDKSVSSTDVPKDLILRFGSYTDNAADLDPNGAGKTVFTDLEETNLKPYPAGELPTIADPKTDSLQTAEGGWSRSLGCGGNRFVCGFQTRLLERASDNMGLTDLKLFCCKFVQ